MVLLTGDTHGEKDWIKRFNNIQLYGNIIIVLGDFGFIWDGSEEEKDYLDELQLFCEKNSCTICFLDGNHENFDILNSCYPVESWNEGQVHIIRSSIFHLMRGQIYSLSGAEGIVRVFTMGGGSSIDYARRVTGVSYWEAEMPTAAEIEEAKQNILNYQYPIDFVLSHTAPENTMTYFNVRKLTLERELNQFLQWVKDTIKPRCMYYGHLHMSTQLLDDEAVLYTKVKNLETNEYL